MHINFSFRLMFIVCAVFASVGTAAAQGICILGEYKRSSISGNVRLTNKIPIEGALVKVRKNGAMKKVLTTALTDSRGKFSFPALKKGIYYLEFEYPTLHKQYARVTISRRIDKQKQLFIDMEGFPNEPCGGGTTYIM